MPGASVIRWMNGEGPARMRASSAAAACTSGSGCHSMLRVRAV